MTIFTVTSKALFYSSVLLQIFEHLSFFMYCLKQLSLRECVLNKERLGNKKTWTKTMKFHLHRTGAIHRKVKVMPNACCESWWSAVLHLYQNNIATSLSLWKQLRLSNRKLYRTLFRKTMSEVSLKASVGEFKSLSVEVLITNDYYNLRRCFEYLRSRSHSLFLK